MRHFLAIHWNMSLCCTLISLWPCVEQTDKHTQAHTNKEICKSSSMYLYLYTCGSVLNKQTRTNRHTQTNKYIKIQVWLYLHTCGSVLHLFILCFRFLSMVACVIVSMIVSMVACEKQSWNNLCCITFPCGERRINNSNNLIYMYNSNRPRSSFYKGTGHFRHNHFKDIVWYSSIAKMVLYVQCDLWTFCGALKTDFSDLYRSSMSTTMGVQK